MPLSSSKKDKREFSPRPVVASAGSASPAPAPGAALSQSLPAHLVRNESAISAKGGISGLGLNQFSDNDRFAAIVKFLANPDVFRQVDFLLMIFFVLFLSFSCLCLGGWNIVRKI
jgi:hypothetical protein